MKGKEPEKTEEFIPRGAIALFIIMMVMFLIMWFSIYFEVLSRG